jgi:hypothetical protein
MGRCVFAQSGSGKISFHGKTGQETLTAFLTVPPSVYSKRFDGKQSREKSSKGAFFHGPAGKTPLKWHGVLMEP